MDGVGCDRMWQSSRCENSARAKAGGRNTGLRAVIKALAPLHAALLLAREQFHHLTVMARRHKVAW